MTSLCSTELDTIFLAIFYVDGHFLESGARSVYSKLTQCTTLVDYVGPVPSNVFPFFFNRALVVVKYAT